MEKIIVTNKIDISNENGFSLIEVMVSLTILAVGLLGIAMLQIVAIKGNASGSKMTEVSTLIGNQIEDYRQMVYEDVADKIEENITHQNGNRIYKRTTKVEEDTPEPGLKTVTVELSWTDNRPHSVSFSTIISNL